VTRSTVQKAVVVLASKVCVLTCLYNYAYSTIARLWPYSVLGLISPFNSVANKSPKRDKLGVITQALFNQR
jgi:hypothetical protein